MDGPERAYLVDLSVVYIGGIYRPYQLCPMNAHVGWGSSKGLLSAKGLEYSFGVGGGEVGNGGRGGIGIVETLKNEEGTFLGETGVTGVEDWLRPPNDAIPSRWMNGTG